MIRATVRWFDSMSGEGMVRMPDGRSVFVHWTAFDLSLVDIRAHGNLMGRACEVETFEDYNWSQVSKLKLITKES